MILLLAHSTYMSAFATYHIPIAGFLWDRKVYNLKNINLHISRVSHFYGCMKTLLNRKYDWIDLGYRKYDKLTVLLLHLIAHWNLRIKIFFLKKNENVLKKLLLETKVIEFTWRNWMQFGSGWHLIQLIDID